jgi:CRP-like cAMP-binding protein
MTNESTYVGNRLLARLPPNVLERLKNHLQPMQLDVGQVLHEARTQIELSYFPLRGTLSAVAVMRDGSMIEVATIGYEGAAGLPRTSPVATSPNRVFCQVAGDCLRIETSVLHRAAQSDESTKRLFEAYYAAFLFQVSQSVACNGLHTVPKRCCRWLLMTHDRVQQPEIRLTHEFLSNMLGVRRSTVTEILQTLEKEGLIVLGRGKITVVDRAGLEAASCECYGDVRAEYERLLG